MLSAHALSPPLILRGKTQMDELAYSLNGENSHYGTPLNPAAPGRIPGGSSSGSAVSVRARFLYFKTCKPSPQLALLFFPPCSLPVPPRTLTLPWAVTPEAPCECLHRTAACLASARATDASPSSWLGHWHPPLTLLACQLTQRIQPCPPVLHLCFLFKWLTGMPLMRLPARG